jgi:glucosylceramidase
VSSEPTRRSFLKISALGIAASSASRWPAAFAAPAGEISVRVTGGTLRYSASPAISWRSGEGGGNNLITLDPSQRFQDVLGFGAAFTDASCYAFNRLDPAARESVFHELFHP